MNKLIEPLLKKDDKKAYDRFKELEVKSAASAELYQYTADMAVLLKSNRSFVRTRGFRLLCAQARWDDEGQLRRLIGDMMAGLPDEKPTAVRQDLAALRFAVLFRPELDEAVRQGLQKINPAKYSESMQPLIQKDIAELLKMLD